MTVFHCFADIVQFFSVWPAKTYVFIHSFSQYVLTAFGVICSVSQFVQYSTVQFHFLNLNSVCVYSSQRHHCLFTRRPCSCYEVRSFAERTDLCCHNSLLPDFSLVSPEMTKKPKIRRCQRHCRKLFTDVNDTSDKFFAGVTNTVLPMSANLHMNLKIKQKFGKVQSTKPLTIYEKIYTSKFFSFIAGVVDTDDKHSLANISSYFRKNSKWS
jgi:hypothetical protein